MPKESQGSIADADVYLNGIRTLTKKYRRIVDTLETIKKDKKKTNEKMDLLNERALLHKEFTGKKKSARAQIRMLAENVRPLKERELTDVLGEFREVDNEFRAMGLLAEKDALMEGAASRAGEKGFDPSRAKNDELLDRAHETQVSTTEQLKGALSTVEATKEQARYTAAQLEQDRDKIKRIDAGLDDVESELQLSRVLITRFVKSIYTDKIIIGLIFLVVCGIAGIIAYSVINPNQSLFSVPDAVKPSIAGITTPTYMPTPTASPHARLLRASR